MTEQQGPTEPPASDIERLAAAIRGLTDIRADLRAAEGGVSPVLGLRSVYDRQLGDVESEIRAVYANLIKDEAHRWASARPGTVEMILPDGESPRSEEHTSELQSQSNLVC